MPLLPGALTSEASATQEAASTSSTILRAAVLDSGIGEPAPACVASPAKSNVTGAGGASPAAAASPRGEDPNPTSSKKQKITDVRLERGKRQKSMAEERPGSHKLSDLG
eukprot:9007786-Alexandrium_andersonii.AAC.1